MILKQDLFINKNITAREAMKAIDDNGLGIVFIVNKKKILKGTLTAGDIRRAIDNGFDVNSSVEQIINTNFLTISDELNPKKFASEIISKLKIKEKEVNEEIYSIRVPVLNKKNQIIKILSYFQDKDGISISLDFQKNNNGTKRILIVGGAGYLGSTLTRLLLEKGYYVRVLDSLLFGKKSLVEFTDNPNFQLIKGDLRDIQIVHKSLDQIDSVIHLAAIVGDPASQKHPQDTIGVNYLATMTLAMACKYYQINKFIFASTCSVYGIGSKQLDEKAELNPVSLYARTKIESEKGIISLTDNNFKPVIMRMSTLYGMSSRMRFDLVVNTFAKNATVNKKITIFGGKQWRPLLHVEDAARAYVEILEKPLEKFDDLIFNVGTNDQNFMIEDLANMVKEVILETKIEVGGLKKESAEDKRTYKVLFDKIENGLGFRALHTVKDSLRKINKAISDGTIKNVQDKNYYNVEK